MSIFIFTKEDFLYRIASSQSVYDDNKNWSDINSIIKSIEDWLESNDSKPLASNVTLYLNYLKSIDISSFTYPLNYSLESYVEDQGLTAIHPLELL